MIRVADNLQITHPTVEKALQEMNPEPLQQIVRRCEKAGAQAIDINFGPLPKEGARKMALGVEAIQDICDLPVLIDTANSEAIEAGLKANRKTAIINGFSLESNKLETILPLAKKYQADIIGFLLYPNGHVPANASERLNIAIDIFTEMQKAGIDKEHLIIDPIIAPIIWQNGTSQAKEILTTLQGLPEILGFSVRSIAGLSNLTAGSGYYSQRILLEKTYLPMLAASGLTMVLMNIFHRDTVKVARACKVLTNPGVFAWEEL
jgi:5-methyltetrahydrofolate corrinoid/iron sulfur protein methyltransferase